MYLITYNNIKVRMTRILFQTGTEQDVQFRPCQSQQSCLIGECIYMLIFYFSDYRPRLRIGNLDAGGNY